MMEDPRKSAASSSKREGRKKSCREQCFDRTPCLLKKIEKKKPGEKGDVEGKKRTEHYFNSYLGERHQPALRGTRFPARRAVGTATPLTGVSPKGTEE